MKEKLISWIRIDLKFAVTVGLLIFLIVEFRDDLLVALPESSFNQASFMGDLLSANPLIFGIALVVLVLNYLPFKWNRLRGQWNWNRLDDSGRLRIFVMVIVVIMGWSYSAYEYNFFFDQPYYIERIALVSLVIACWFSPIFVGPMCVLTYATSSQMLYPGIIGYSYTDKLVAFEILLLFSFFTYLRPITRTDKSAFVFTALCIVGAFYFYPSQKKVNLASQSLSWVVDNDLHNLFISSYINGWLSFLPMNVALGITRTMGEMRTFLQFMTLVIELSGLFILLFNRRFSMFMLFFAITLHLGIFASSGVFFWKWIVLDAAFIVYLWRSKRDMTIRQIYRPIYGIASLFIIGYANIFGAIELGWWDGSVNNYFDFEVIDTQGNSFEYPRSYMQPYDMRFTQSRLNFLVDEPLIANTYGSFHNSFPYFNLREHGVDVLDDMKGRTGRNDYRESRVDKMHFFLLEYFTSYNRRLHDTFLPSIIRPPLHIVTMPRENAYNKAYPIQTVRVWFTETFFDGTTVTTLQHRIVLEVEIPVEDIPQG